MRSKNRVASPPLDALYMVLLTLHSKNAGWNTQKVSLERAEIAEASRTLAFRAAVPPMTIEDSSLAVAAIDARATVRSITSAFREVDVVVRLVAAGAAGGGGGGGGRNDGR